MAYELKTKKNSASVDEFIAAVEPDEKRNDCIALDRMMREVTGEPGSMWGGTIVGFGKHSYKYASGHGGEYFLTGFSSRKQNLTIYIMPGFERFEELMAKLGKHKTGKSCLYVKRLAGVDGVVLRQLISESVITMRESNPA